mgnify:FL=1
MKVADVLLLGRDRRQLPKLMRMAKRTNSTSTARIRLLHRRRSAVGSNGIPSSHGDAPRSVKAGLRPRDRRHKQDYVRTMTHLTRTYRTISIAAFGAMIATHAVGQNATYSYFGTAAKVACSPVQQAVQHTALNLPRIGTTFMVQLPASNGPCSYLCNLMFVTTGFSNTSFQGVALPYTPLPFTTPVPTCGSLLVSLDHIDFAPTGTTGGAMAQIALQIPNATNLIGLNFYQQAFSMTYVLGSVNSIALGRGGHGMIGL